MYLKGSYFPHCSKVLSVARVFKNVGERFTDKNYCPVSLTSAVSKVFGKLRNNRLVDLLEIYGLFVIPRMVSGLSVQLQIFLQLYLVELLWHSLNLGPLELWHCGTGFVWRCSGVLIGSFEQIWQLFLMFSLLTLSRYMPTGA